MISILAAITTEQVDAWTGLIDHILNRVGEIVILALAIWTKVEASANTQRLNRQGERLKQVETVATVIDPAAIAPTPVAPAPTVEEIADAAAAKAVANVRVKIRDAAAKAETPQ